MSILSSTNAGLSSYKEALREAVVKAVNDNFIEAFIKPKDVELTFNGKRFDIEIDNRYLLNTKRSIILDANYGQKYLEKIVGISGPRDQEYFNRYCRLLLKDWKASSSDCFPLITDEKLTLIDCEIDEIKDVPQTYEDTFHFTHNKLHLEFAASGVPDKKNVVQSIHDISLRALNIDTNWAGNDWKYGLYCQLENINNVSISQYLGIPLAMISKTAISLRLFILHNLC